jgi:hypothetical protein
MLMKYPRRFRNPFGSPLLDDQQKLDDAYAVVQDFMEKARANMLESPLSPEEDPTGWYSPLNIALHAFDPIVAESLADILLKGTPRGETGRFYRDAVSRLESDETLKLDPYSMEVGQVPESWLQEREMKFVVGKRSVKKKRRPIDLLFDDDLGYYDPENPPAGRTSLNAEQMVEDLNWGKKRKKAPKNKRRN